MGGGLRNVIFGGRERDTIFGASHRSTIHGGAGADMIDGIRNTYRFDNYDQSAAGMSVGWLRCSFGSSVPDCSY